MRLWPLMFLNLCVFAGQVGCTCRPGRSAGPAVGHYEGGEITAQDLQREANRLPPVLRKQFETHNGRRELVSALIDKRLLAREAERRGFRDDPEIKQQVAELEERLTVQALLAAEERAAVISDAEAREYYETHRQELTRPERVRVSRILAKVEPNAPAAARTAARAKAERLAARVRKGEAFAKVAEQAEGAERAHGGDLGLLVRGATADKRLEEAAFRLSKPGEVSPVFECDGGFAVLQLSEKRPPSVPSFEEVKGEVENRLVPIRRRKVFDDLLVKLRAKGDVRVDVAGGPG
jgi:peptidyl-prolyl cis-trans isomerase C